RARLCHYQHDLPALARALHLAHQERPLSRDRGHALQRALAAYLTRWWPNAESTPNGRSGRDVLGTPGVWWECKTSLKGTSPAAIVQQAVDGSLIDCAARRDDPDLPVAGYFPAGLGAPRAGGGRRSGRAARVRGGWGCAWTRATHPSQRKGSATKRGLDRWTCSCSL